MAEFTVNYTKTIYTNKINKLAGLAEQLKGHLEKLETYKGEVRQFWDDDDATKILEKITDQILKVRDAQENVIKMKTQLEDLVNDVTATSNAVDETISDIGSAIGSVIGLGGGGD